MSKEAAKQRGETWREALWWCRQRLMDVVCGHGKELGDYEKYCREAIDMATEALSTPQRNCGRFASFDDAIKTFAKEEQIEIPWNAEKYARFSMWLFNKTNKKEEQDGKSNRQR